MVILVEKDFISTKKNNMAFTLIELLAIIVILAIIAVITVPIILNIIDNSKRGAATDSAYGYKNAVEKFYVTNLSIDSNFNFNNGIYTTEQLKSMGVTVNGKEPGSNSWVSINKNNISSGCLQFDEYKVDIRDGVVFNAVKGICGEAVIFNGTYVAPGVSDTHLGIVYLDPTDLSNVCDDIHYASTPGTKEGCMKFYIFDENEDGTVDMILDHNTSLGISWTLYKDNGNLTAYYGPREGLYQLYEDTNNWDAIADLTESSNYVPSSMHLNHAPYEIQYTSHLTNTFEQEAGAHKARFISAEEIANIVNKDDFSLGHGSFYLNSDDVKKSAESPSEYAWLFDNLYNCLVNGCSEESNISTGNNEYWTGSSSAYNSKYAWVVDNYGDFKTDMVRSTSGGIRPVITVSKSVLGIN